MKLLAKEQQNSYENEKICYICKEELENKYLKYKNCGKVIDHCHDTGEYGGTAYSICNSKYRVSKSISIIIHNGSNYNYDFIIKAEEFKNNLLV